MADDQEKFEQRYAAQINPPDRERLFEHIVLKKDLILLLTATRLELHKIKDRTEFYSRRLLWYQPVENIQKDSVQGYDVQHQGAVTTRVMIVINNTLYLYLINFSPWGFRNCVCLAKLRLVEETEESISVFDARFFNDFDVAYTKKVDHGRVAPELAEENQKVFLCKIRSLALDPRLRRTQQNLNSIKTKNFSQEPMKISFCARYLHLLLGTSKTIQILCVPIYMTPDLSEKDADDQYELNALQKDREARTKPWHERYGDSVLKDLDFNHSKKFLSKYNTNEEKIKMFEKLKVAQNNTIHELASTNLYPSDRLVFYVEQGFNPRFVVEGCYCSGLKTILSYNYEEIFEKSLDAGNIKEHTFSNLQVHLESIYDTYNESKPSAIMLELIEDRRIEGREPAQSEAEGSERQPMNPGRVELILLMRIIYYHYRITFYCPEEDNLVILWLRIKESQHYAPRPEIFERETEVSDFKKNKAKYKYLGHLKYKHEVLDNNREVILKFAENQLGAVEGPRIQTRPRDMLGKCMFTSHDHEPPFVKQFVPVENPKHPETGFYRKDFTRYGIDHDHLRVDPIMDQFYWLEQNWCVKLVGIEKNANKHTHKSNSKNAKKLHHKFCFKGRDQDQDSLTALEEFQVNLKRRLEKMSTRRASPRQRSPGNSGKQSRPERDAYDTDPYRGSKWQKNSNQHEPQATKTSRKGLDWDQWSDGPNEAPARNDGIAPDRNKNQRVGRFKDDSQSPSQSSNRSSPRQTAARGSQKDKQTARPSTNGTFEESELFPPKSKGSRKTKPEFDSLSRISRKEDHEADKLSSMNTSFQRSAMASLQLDEPSLEDLQDNLTFHNMSLNQDDFRPDSIHHDQFDKREESRFSFQRDKSSLGDESLATNQFQDFIDSANNSMNVDFLQEEDWKDFRRPEKKPYLNQSNLEEPSFNDSHYQSRLEDRPGDHSRNQDNQQKPRRNGFKKNKRR